MKCKSCGKEVSADIKICPNCGYDLEETKNYKKVIVEEDPDLPKEQKSSLIDGPVLTFILGIICAMIGLAVISYKAVVLFLVILEVVAFASTFLMSIKLCKVSMRPVRNIGVVLAYIGLGLTIFKVFYVLLG